MKKAIDWIKEKVVNVLVPARCGMCGEEVEENGTLCAKCYGHLKFIRKPCCKLCGRPFDFDIVGESLCGSCLKQKPVYEKAHAVLIYNQASKRLILPFKHADRLDLTGVLVKFMIRAWPEMIEKADVIVPVPLHMFRLLRRHYNQAALLAKAVAKQNHKLYCPEVLRRRKKTLSQGHLSPKERHKNVSGAFEVRHSDRIQGKRILLIDDVYTTGATVNECAKVLLKAGAASVSCLTLAKVVR